MNALIHGDVFISEITADLVDSSSLNILTEAEKYPKLNLWVTADSLQDIAKAASKHMTQAPLAAFLDTFCERVTVIPLRQENILAGVGNEEHGHQLSMLAQVAKQFRLSVIVVPNGPEAFQLDGIPVCPLDEFWKMVSNPQDNDAQVTVPFLDLHAQLHQIYTGIDARFTDIISKTGYILGAHVTEFEEGFARLHDAQYCLGVSNGTAALHIALEVLGIGPGDRVILPVNTFIATAEAVSLTGAEPVFIDCDSYSNIDVQACREYLVALTAKGASLPKAIIPVHLYGQLANMNELASLAQEYELDLVEDACQAHLATWSGKKAGTWGRFAAFSFYPGKNLGAFGEGGALITNEPELYEAALMYRQHGEKERYYHHIAGHNYRMEAFQGAVLAEKLAFIADWTKSRQAHAVAYNRELADIEMIDTPRVRPEADCVYHLYVVHSPQRDALKAHLEQGGIYCGLHYPTPLHLQPAYRGMAPPGAFPVAEKMASRLLSLPMFPELTASQISYVCRTIREFDESAISSAL